MSAFDGTRVRARLFTGGFAEAHERFKSAEASNDREASFQALFEALNWAHAVDDLIAQTWSPRGSVQGDDWRADPALGVGDELPGIMDGLRYVRNRVHHQWADAVIPEESAVIIDSTAYSPWVWRRIDDLPVPVKGREDPRGRAAYEKSLAGREAHKILGHIREAFAFIGSLLDPPIAGRASEPLTYAERLKRSAEDGHVSHMRIMAELSKESGDSRYLEQALLEVASAAFSMKRDPPIHQDSPESAGLMVMKFTSTPKGQEPSNAGETDDSTGSDSPPRGP